MARPRKVVREVRFPAVWFKECGSIEEKQALEAMLKGSVHVFNVLNGLINSMKASVNDRRLALDGYDKPAWPYLQAELNGEERCLKQLQSLLPTEVA